MLHPGPGRDSLSYRGIQERQDHEKDCCRYHAERAPHLSHQRANDKEVAYERSYPQGRELGPLPAKIQAGQAQEKEENRDQEKIVHPLPPRTAAQNRGPQNGNWLILFERKGSSRKGHGDQEEETGKEDEGKRGKGEGRARGHRLGGIAEEGKVS